ncbi:MAG: hypothetical protein AAFX39_17690, partial [Pseudomonadota bacterium]
YYLRSLRGKAARIKERVDPNRGKKGDKAVAQASTGPLFKAPKGAPDDLTRISGVGEVIVEKLNALGITQFEQIANFSDDDIAKVDERLNFKGRIEREDWISQARALIAEATQDEIPAEEPAADEASAEAENKQD